jgi:hypothetical protein
MKRSKTDISKHMQNYVGIICLLLNKRNVLVCRVLKPDGGRWGKNTVAVSLVPFMGEKPSLALGQSVTMALNCV